ncbi:hypothetical protein BGZ93_008392 [Podila epicladia]|nr:hypothetical protein BGZ92_011564 [Podila epicladia]KAG0092273.1 hypothetical protein BGZ93_008392 [Podila epicladia]
MTESLPSSNSSPATNGHHHDQGLDKATHASDQTAPQPSEIDAKHKANGIANTGADPQPQAHHRADSVDLTDEDQRHQQRQEAQRHQREQSHEEHHQRFSKTGAKDHYRENTDELYNNDPEEEDAKNHMSSDEKYRRLKKKLKEVLEENIRVNELLEKSQRRVRNLRREKNLLLDRLMTMERREHDSGEDTISTIGSDSDSSEASVEDMWRRPSSPRNFSGQNPSTAQSTTKVVHHPKKNASRPGVSGTKPASAPIPSAIINVGSATQKPKRVHHSNKPRQNLTKIRKVIALERDENGQVKFPVTIGIIKVISLGHVVHDREAFHNERYIWPVGYKMSRSYNSMVDPTQQTVYTCSVIDDGDAPKFQIDAEDQPGKPIIAGTATGAWTHIVKQANLIRRRDHSNSASGPDYFGFSNATIAKMIQDLPGADLCTAYIMHRFEEASAPTPAPPASSARSSKPLAEAKSGQKRKMSVQEGRTEEKEEGQGSDEEDDYASLGTPKQKQKVTAPSPKIRHAGLPSSSKQGNRLDLLKSVVLEVGPVKEKQTENDDEETQSESDQYERWAAIVSKHRGSTAASTGITAEPKPRHSIAMLSESAAPTVVTTTTSATPPSAEVLSASPVPSRDIAAASTPPADQENRGEESESDVDIDGEDVDMAEVE